MTPGSRNIMASVILLMVGTCWVINGTRASTVTTPVMSMVGVFACRQM
jgi:hypothetical protein